ncbi:MAG: glycoside hydrolase family 97 protein [Bacteroidales bacterium]|nr:glycoside hydrolase family 97 protein [Bacteroidales bacterium]
MKRVIVSFALAVLFSIASVAAPKQYSVASPDGSLKATITTGDQISWTLSKDGKTILSPSNVSMTLTNGTVYGGSAKPIKASTKSVNQSIKTVVYKKAVVEDVFNELTLRFKDFDVVFRAYDDAVAYRFVSKSKSSIEVKNEQAEFVFDKDYSAYVPYVRDYTVLKQEFSNSFENIYTHTAISKWNKEKMAFLPLVVEAGDYKVAITESDLLDYPGMYLYAGASEGDGSVEVGPVTAETGLKGVFAPYPKTVQQGGHNELEGLVKETENYIAKAAAGAAFPWRIVGVASEDKDLLNSDIVYKLSRPVAEGSDFSWVKPGKVAWDWWNDWNVYGVDFKAGINNDTYKYYIDFASKNGIEYVILDEGWAVNLKADLFQVIPEIDLKELVEYANSKNVGLILWAGYWAFNRDIEKVCKTYSEMGIKGFKVDFMNRDDQEMVAFFTKSAEIAAKYHLMLDFHGAFKPSGLQRPYPNVINYEGVNGLEQMKWSSASLDQVLYDVTIPYTRMFAGSMDYTQGAMRNSARAFYSANYSEPMSQGTRCHQLAEYVIFESPLNMLCDSPSNYMAEPECTEYIAKIPTVWDETIALDGKLAKYAVIARRSGDTWYVGALNDWSAKDLEIDLGFLGEGNFQMTIFKDGVNASKAARDYKKETISVPSSRKVNIHMAPGGGWTAKIIRK